MADIKWTPEQLDAITARGNDILVSAAAGSGKTAVLVERVLRMVTDPEHPVDISSLLMITFTRAAAAQMKDKIFSKLRDEVRAHPDNEFLKKQLQDVHCARIYTIDALCMEIVRDNFQDVDIDPGFRIAQENESAALMADVLGELIEEKYADPSPEFLKFVNFYIDKSDAKLEEIILTMYRYAQSYPEPEAWISKSVLPYSAACDLEPGGEDRTWLCSLAEEISEELDTVRELAEMGLAVCGMNHGPFKYTGLFEEILVFTDTVTDEDCMFDFRGEELRTFLADWKRAPSIQAKDGVDPELKEAAQGIRGDIRKHLQYLAEHFFAKDLEDAYRDMAGCLEVAQVIADLTLSFSRRLLEAKKEQGLFDFGDIAHFALEVLLETDGQGNFLRDGNGQLLRTETASHLAAGITEIVVDEYQDTNMIQEYIINALSSGRDGRADIFMVGDVKQSIYGFRLACPELFIEKYNSYDIEPGPESAGRKILLNANFRSRHQVLDIANHVFERAMISEVGGIDYTDGHALIPGASYPEADSDHGDPFAPEVIIVDGSGEDARKSEAYIIAKKIEELIEDGCVSESGGDRLRPVRYSDIAILTRNSDNPEIEQMLEARNIPVIRSSNRGFFDTFEIRLTMDLLSVIDNPYQDIPLAAVLTSPAFGLDENDLARIHIFCGNDRACLYEGCRRYAEDMEDGLASRIRAFLSALDDYRKRASYMGVSDLIGYCLAASGLDDIIAAMPQGEGRRANIDFLKNRALQGTEGSQGLFMFIRHIRQMQDADMDFGQAQVFAGDVDAVRMMTIHKSKGLEFPVVFVARAGKDYNQSDLRANIILDRRLGMGLELRDPVERTVMPTLLLETIKAARKRELFAEEMRLLYVAMTRAKEKLIITGQIRGAENAAAQWSREKFNPKGKLQLSAAGIMDSGSFLKLTGRALSGDESFDIKTTGIIETEEERAGEMLDREAFLADMEGFIRDAQGGMLDSDLADQAERLGSILSWRYPYEEATRRTVKITASQMEDHSAGADSEDRVVWPEPYSGKESEKSSGLTGAERGNAYHRLFELLEYDLFARYLEDRDPDEHALNAAAAGMIESLKSRGLISSEYADAAEPSKIAQFLLSELGRRMFRAAAEGRLRREQQFVMGYEEDGEQMLVQGIIDAFFIENGSVVLVDYKTDRYKTEEELIRTYKGQLQIYSDAIESATGMKVSEKVIYSVEMSRAVYL